MRLFVLVEFDANPFGVADALPGFGEGRGSAPQRLVDFFFRGAVITLHRAHFWDQVILHKAVSLLFRSSVQSGQIHCF